MIILKNNNYNNNKQNTYNRQNTYKGRKKSIILIYYIQTVKRLKGHVYLTYGTSTILFALKILPFQHGLLL